MLGWAEAWVRVLPVVVMRGCAVAAALTAGAAPQVIAAFNRVRMLTQDWAVIVEALTGSPVVEIGASGALLRAREGWANWVLPPDQRDKSAHAALTAPTPAASAAQTPLQSPQRPHAASDMLATALSTFANGPVDSSLPESAVRRDGSGAADAPAPARDVAPAADAERPPAPMAEDACEPAPHENEQAAPAGSAAHAATDTAGESAVTAPVPSSTAGGEPKAAVSADVQASATSAAAQSAGETGRSSERGGDDAVPTSATSDAPASTAEAAEPGAAASVASDHGAPIEHRAANEQAVPASAAPAKPVSAASDEPHAVPSAEQSASTATMAPGGASAPAADAAAAVSGHRMSEDLEDDMFQLDEVRTFSRRLSLDVCGVAGAEAAMTDFKGLTSQRDHEAIQCD